MGRKRALVVDDSKSARVILSRMLEKYDIDVDMAESAEQAIEYLKHERPDAIFMDHLMPGMDGLQAVKAIKSNPQTAMIPIMMYTSQEGELYVGQARALGAMGVLPKQVRPVDVSKILYELHLLPDRRDLEQALLPVEIDGEAVAVTGSGTPDWGHRIEAVVKEQSADIRRFIVASLDGFASRVVDDVGHATRVSAAEGPIETPVVPPPRVWPWIGAVTLLASMLVAAASFWALTREDLTRARAELAALTSANADLVHTRDAAAATNTQLTAALEASAAKLAAALPAAPTATVRIEPVPYGEIPFDRSRLDALREFLAKLEVQGFHGVVKITSAAGMFCLSGNASDGFSPAAPGLLVGKCDLVGNPFDESLNSQQRQTLGFANLLASVRQRSGGAISVVIDTAGSSRVAAPYPTRSEVTTAGEWNRAAAANNRVEFYADPSP